MALQINSNACGITPGCFKLDGHAGRCSTSPNFAALAASLHQQTVSINVMNAKLSAMQDVLLGVKAVQVTDPLVRSLVRLASSLLDEADHNEQEQLNLCVSRIGAAAGVISYLVTEVLMTDDEGELYFSEAFSEGREKGFRAAKLTESVLKDD